jgi:hypothetical protein
LGILFFLGIQLPLGFPLPLDSHFHLDDSHPLFLQSLVCSLHLLSNVLVMQVPQHCLMSLRSLGGCQ